MIGFFVYLPTNIVMTFSYIILLILVNELNPFADNFFQIEAENNAVIFSDII